MRYSPEVACPRTVASSPPSITARTVTTSVKTKRGIRRPPGSGKAFRRDGRFVAPARAKCQGGGRPHEPSQGDEPRAESDGIERNGEEPGERLHDGAADFGRQHQ